MRWPHALSGVALAAGSLACADEPLAVGFGRNAGTGGAGSAGAGGADAGAPLWACPVVETKPAALVSPDPRRSWAGAVAIVTAPLMEGIPLAGWSVDGAPRPPPGPDYAWIGQRAAGA